MSVSRPAFAVIHEPMESHQKINRSNLLQTEIKTTFRSGEQVENANKTTCQQPVQLRNCLGVISPSDLQILTQLFRLLLQFFVDGRIQFFKPFPPGIANTIGNPRECEQVTGCLFQFLISLCTLMGHCV